MNYRIESGTTQQLSRVIDEQLHGDFPLGNSEPFALLLALTEDDAGAAALALTHALVRDRGAVPTVVRVVEVVSAALPAFAAMTGELYGPEYYAERAATLRARYMNAGGLPDSWPIEVYVGDPAAYILTCAREMHAQLIVMGLRHHGTLARAMGDDTVRDVMRAGVAPVLAVRGPVTGLPRRVLVAMDFSPASIRAARLARRLMHEHGTMYLAHVESTLALDDSEYSEGIRMVQTAGIAGAFEQVENALAPTPGMTFTRATLHGDPIKELEILAEAVEPDLVVIGSQRHKWLDRLLLGSVATAIVHDGRWSVLVTPPAIKPLSGDFRS